jgi:hypothetical protein
MSPGAQYMKTTPDPGTQNMKTGPDDLGTVENEFGSAKYENQTRRTRYRRK